MSPSWKELQRAVGELTPEGQQGFEGMIRELFEAETSMSFYLARKGDQPVADVYSPRAAAALQAKRYTKAHLSENEVEGDIDRALREAPTLDVYVLAATRPLAQLAARLASKTRETGLDVLPLFLSDGLSEFGALCVTHWEVVQKFLLPSSAEWRQWAGEESAKAEVRAALQRFRQSFQGLATRNYVSEQSALQLAERFRGEGAGARTHNRVLLSEALPRANIERQLRTWWKGRNSPIAVLEGEDGMGKTWVAAQFVEHLLKSDAPVVFWLDSLTWGQTNSVENLVDTALQAVFLADEPLRARIKRKIFHQWQQPVLLVLDGANERSAWKASDCLLRDYFTHADKLRSRLRVLFTSRPLGQRTSRRDFWRGCLMIPVGGFDDAEFQAALAKLAPDVPAKAFTAAVRDLAVVPRYFRLCIRLQDRLASLQHLNKQVLLWAEVQEKLASGDPQLATLTEELGGSPEEILACLAKQVGWPKSNEPSLATNELERTFPNFLKARADLAEQHIVLNAGFDITTLSSEHVVLGWALMLRQLAERHLTEDADSLRERLVRELEPAGSNDDKVRAVHVAALLTFLDDGRDAAKTQRAPAALLSLWVSHHNAGVNEEALRFFVGSDIAAYTCAIEVLFREYLPGSPETCLIAPLARVWRDQAPGVETLRDALKQWLTLVYPGDASGSKAGDKQPPERFHAAESPEQLRLSYAAIGVVSFRPEIQLLPSLMDCHTSHDFCYADRHVGKTKHRYSIKSPGEQLGVLLRWSYTESIVPLLEAHSARLTPGSEEADDLLWFSRLLRMAELPSRIGSAQDTHNGGATRAATASRTFPEVAAKN